MLHELETRILPYLKDEILLELKIGILTDFKKILLELEIEILPNRKILTRTGYQKPTLLKEQN